MRIALTGGPIPTGHFVEVEVTSRGESSLRDLGPCFLPIFGSFKVERTGTTHAGLRVYRYVAS